jgi:CheY-like chemotaxis protein
MGSILVVDDEPEIRAMLVQALSEEGYAVVAVEHGLAALAYLESDAPTPALIILDMMMPVMNGVQCWRALSAHPLWRSIPVILISGGVFLQHAAQALPLVAVLPKPIHLERLRALVAPYCQPSVTPEDRTIEREV